LLIELSRKRFEIRAKAVIVATIAWLGAAQGCGSSERTATVPNAAPPTRQLTAGDSLLQLLPIGADTLLELDLGRLRNNPSVGKAVRALLTTNREQGGEPHGGLLEVSDTIVVASYGIGTSSTERVILCRGAGVEALANATLVSLPPTKNVLGKTLENIEQENFVVAVIASPQMTRLIEAIAVGNEKPMAADSKLLVLRALAMPTAAEGASFRLSAHLGFDARLALGKAMDLENVPVSVSVWGDVADDLAILVAGKGQPEGRMLVNSLARMRDKFAALTEIRLLGLSRVIRAATLDAQGASARLVLVIGPKRLRRVAERVVRRLEISHQVDNSVTDQPTNSPPPKTFSVPSNDFSTDSTDSQHQSSDNP